MGATFTGGKTSCIRSFVRSFDYSTPCLVRMSKIAPSLGTARLDMRGFFLPFVSDGRLPWLPLRHMPYPGSRVRCKTASTPVPYQFSIVI